MNLFFAKVKTVLQLLTWGTDPANDGEISYNGTKFRVKENGTVKTIVFDEDVKGGANSLNDRLGVISNFASPNAGGIVSGFYYDNNPHGVVQTLAGSANRFDLFPYYSSMDLPINQIGCAVSTAVAGSLFKIVIYKAGSNGWPDELLYESADISGATAVYAFETLSFTFQKGVQYWLGVRHSSTCTLRAISTTSAHNLGLGNSGAQTQQMGILRRTLTYATAAPNPFDFLSSDLSTAFPTSVRFRAV